MAARFAVTVGMAWVLAAAPAGAVPSLTARAVLVVDHLSGETLLERNAARPLPPASTTKVLTALLALRSGRLGEAVPVSARAAAMPPTRAGLRPGLRVRLDDLVHAMLLASANDAAVAVAEAVGGSVEQFAALMNATARSLGATGSHFVNPHGLPARGHYATARDLVTILRHALNYPHFREILGKRRWVIRPAAGGRVIVVRNRNRLLRRRSPTTILGKTGYTRRAGRCFLGMAARDGREVVFALLGSRDLWGDIRRLVAYALTRASEGGGGLEEPEWLEVLVALPPADPAAIGEGDLTEEPARPDRYALQLASFRSPRRARRLAEEVENAGYAASVERVGRRSRPWYRVSAGGFATREEARLAARELARRHRIRPVVTERAAD